MPAIVCAPPRFSSGKVRKATLLPSNRLKQSPPPAPAIRHGAWAHSLLYPLEVSRQRTRRKKWQHRGTWAGRFWCRVDCVETRTRLWARRTLFSETAISSMFARNVTRIPAAQDTSRCDDLSATRRGHWKYQVVTKMSKTIGRTPTCH